MAYEHLKQSTLAGSLSAVLADLSDVIQKELRLARAEISEKLANKLRAGAWMSVAGVLGLVAVVLVAEALVFGIASYGIALHWACLIVAAAVVAAAGFAYLCGRADAKEDLSPTRTLRQIKQDIAVTKEHLT